jgi:hypothetical protein
MAWNLVPVWRGDFDFFGRQRDLFSDWLEQFEDDWRLTSFEDSERRFHDELDRVRRELHQMDAEPSLLSVKQPFVTGKWEFMLKNIRILMQAIELDLSETLSIE